MKKYDVCVVGLGYIGLPTALLFARKGKRVLGYDVSESVVRKVNAGESGKNEPNLDELLMTCVDNGTLVAATKPEKAALFIIAVPTPFEKGNHPVMTYVQKALESILPYVEKGNAIVLESTSPVGSTEKYICAPLCQNGLIPGEDVYVAYSPERVLPGNILNELIRNNRMIGGVNEKSALLIKDFFKLFVEGDIETTDIRTAEMCKLLENAYRDVNIAFANEMAKMCKKAGVNPWEVQRLCNKHPRVNILSPGPGVGGHCIAVDPWFLVDSFPDETAIIKTGRLVNDTMPGFVLEQIKDILPEPNGHKIAVLGITYKPDVEDTRESPIIELIKLLVESGYEIAIHDPFVEKGLHGNTDFDDCLKEADLLVLGVNHKVFKNIDLQKAYTLMRHKYILDTRNAIAQKEAEQAGFDYYLLGRGKLEPAMNR